MDVLAALNSQLHFIRSFYVTAATSFEDILRKYSPLNRSEAPLPYESEKWQDARKGVEILGQCSVSLVAKAIEDCLRQFVLREVGEKPALEGKSRFEKYENFLLTKTAFRWHDCPVQRDRIEQINLCRNDFLHDLSIDSTQPKKSGSHFEKYPISRFDDNLGLAIEAAIAQVSGEEPPNTPGSLTVTRQELLNAIDDARQFCAFVETKKASKQ